MPPSPLIRPCGDEDLAAILATINAGAEAYRAVIPADRWHEPYMSASELRSEIAAGVTFFACEEAGNPIGVIGIQPVRNVDLVRHAYVRPARQRQGIGSALMAYLRARSLRPLLVGTWAAATWAVRFYEREGFTLVPDAAKVLLLRTYWSIPERQVETSVVLASPALSFAEAAKLVAS